jgi:hypothetical protein
MMVFSNLLREQNFGDQVRGIGHVNEFFHRSGVIVGNGRCSGHGRLHVSLLGAGCRGRVGGR